MLFSGIFHFIGLFFLIKYAIIILYGQKKGRYGKGEPRRPKKNCMLYWRCNSELHCPQFIVEQSGKFASWNLMSVA